MREGLIHEVYLIIGHLRSGVHWFILILSCDVSDEKATSRSRDS